MILISKLMEKFPLNDKMGFLTTVDDARKSLENIFKNNIDKPNNP